MSANTKTFIERIFQNKEAKKFEEMLLSNETWLHVGTIAIRIMLIIGISVLIVKTGKLIIRRIFKMKFKGPFRKEERREKTLLKLLENTLTYVIYFSAILSVLTEFSINVRGLLAGAGVMGLAVGFGAQSLVKDVISGFFILFEDQFSVGDYVKIGTAEGVVDEIGLRTTKIKSMTGELSILPNGTIGQVVNYSVKNSMAIVDVTIPHEINLVKAEKAINEYLEKMQAEDQDLMGKPKLVGARDFTDTAVIERIMAETKPMRHYDVARKISIGVREHLHAAGMEIPYPALVTKSLGDS